ncbi:MAG: peptidase S1 [Myxococcota bacterium]|nr:peptidase S1 [Myxococcota bacterium]
MIRAQHSRSRRVALGVAIAALALATVSGTVVAQAGLAIGGSSSNFGSQRLRGGFMPDPHTTQITSGGSLDASRQGLAPGCRGYVTRQPDYIVHYDNPADFLRFYATAGGDTTLVINDANGRWHCNDDSHGGVNPTVDIRNPPAGQYDVWVGSYRASENIRATLHVTELRSQHP